MKFQKISKEDFILKAISVHGNKYDYSKTEYEKSHSKILIICPIHGQFYQRANSHLQGTGCRKCHSEKIKQKPKIKASRKSRYIKKDKIDITTATSFFISKANVVHNDKYDYNKTIYIKSNKKIIITCNEHGDFEQTPNSHLQKRGCPICAENTYGWNKTSFIKRSKNNIAIFYIIECSNFEEYFFKIGITTKSVDERYKNKIKMPYSYNSIFEIKDSPEKIWEIEQKYKKNMKNYSYLPKIEFNGSKKECYII